MFVCLILLLTDFLFQLKHACLKLRFIRPQESLIYTLRIYVLFGVFASIRCSFFSRDLCPLFSIIRRRYCGLRRTSSIKRLQPGILVPLHSTFLQCALSTFLVMNGCMKQRCMFCLMQLNRFHIQPNLETRLPVFSSSMKWFGLVTP